MEEMNEQSFAEMLGTESIDRMNYIDLLEQVRLHVCAEAVIGVCLMSFTNEVEEMVDQLDKDTLKQMLGVTLKAITIAQIRMSQALASEHVLRHYKNIYGTDLTQKELEESSDKEVIRTLMQKHLGFDAVGLMERLVGLSEEEEGE